MEVVLMGASLARAERLGTGSAAKNDQASRGCHDVVWQTELRVAVAGQHNVTDFVLEGGLSSAAETLFDQQIFQLEPEQWKAFETELASPPKVHLRLERLFHERSLLEQGVEEQQPAGGSGRG
jgi:uncharacterized protein (DUF1778 family)